MPLPGGGGGGVTSYEEELVKLRLGILYEIPETAEKGRAAPYFFRKKKDLLVSIKVSGKLSTYPSRKLTLTLTSHLGQNDGLGKG